MATWNSLKWIHYASFIGVGKMPDLRQLDNATIDDVTLFLNPDYPDVGVFARRGRRLRAEEVSNFVPHLVGVKTYTTGVNKWVFYVTLPSGHEAEILVDVGASLREVIEGVQSQTMQPVIAHDPKMLWKLIIKQAPVPLPMEVVADELDDEHGCPNEDGFKLFMRFVRIAAQGGFSGISPVPLHHATLEGRTLVVNNIAYKRSLMVFLRETSVLVNPHILDLYPFEKIKVLQSSITRGLKRENLLLNPAVHTIQPYTVKVVTSLSDPAPQSNRSPMVTRTDTREQSPIGTSRAVRPSLVVTVAKFSLKFYEIPNEILGLSNLTPGEPSDAY
jgi:hypothetical protein